MGSFLTRCAVTQQIISDDEPVRFVPIIAQSTSRATTLFRVNKEGVENQLEVYPAFDHTIYFNAFWTPFGQFMTGTYADYGRFKINETPENEATFKTFLKHLEALAYGTKPGENPYHDLAVDIPALIKQHEPEKGWANIHKLWGAIHDLNHDNRIFICDNIHHGSPRMLQTAVICEDAWQALLKGVTTDFDKAWKEIEAACADREGFVSAALAKRRNGGVVRDYDDAYRKGHFEFLLRDKLERMFGRGEGEYNLIWAPVESYDAAMMLDRGDPLDKVRALIKPTVEETGIKRRLSDLGVKLLPHGYAGQDYGNNTGLTLNMISLRVMIERQRVRDAFDYGDDFLTEELENEDIYTIRARKRVSLFQKLETLVDELEGLATDDENDDDHEG